jgi:hypothetical protein
MASGAWDLAFGQKSVPLLYCGRRVARRFLSVSRANGRDRELGWLFFVQ